MKKKNSKNQSGTNWERLATVTDNEIDLSDSPELGEDFFKNAVLRLPKAKKSVSLRLDPDVLDWFKGRGLGYQTRINAVLRMYVDSMTGTSGRNLRKRRTPSRKRRSASPA